MSTRNLQDYIGRVTKGWNGNKTKVFVCLCLVLQADVYENKVDSYRKEHESQANNYFDPIKELTVNSDSWDGLVQGVVKFDLTKVQESPNGQMIDSWWSAIEIELWIAAKNKRKHT